MTLLRESEPTPSGSQPPPTVIIVHPREKRSKCSVEPLRGRAGFEFRTFDESQPLTLNGYVRLSLSGPLLSPADASSGLLLLDGTWRLAERMESQYFHVPGRSLAAWRTAYPRVSKLYVDPRAGLASVEALYAALIQLGRPTEGILDAYRWRDEFLEINAELIATFRGGAQGG